MAGQGSGSAPLNDLMPLWRIEQELEALVDSLDTCDAELKPELEARIAEYITAEVDKVDRVDAVLASLDGVAENAKREIERLRVRQQSAEKASRRLEGYLLHVLRERGGKPLKGRNVTLSMRKTEALTIVTPELVPEKFKRTTITVDIPKTAVKEAIKAGEDVPGVVLQQNEHLVRK
jgi:hypothetical protein